MKAPGRRDPCMFLIHCTACCCGSIHKGKRDAAVVRMPFWTLCSSAGRPLAVQSWITASLDRKDSRLKFDETGMFNEATCVSQVVFASTASERVVEPSTPSTRRVPRFSPSESGRVAISAPRLVEGRLHLISTQAATHEVGRSEIIMIHHFEREDTIRTVSYTHLTLPTKRIV